MRPNAVMSARHSKDVAVITQALARLLWRPRSIIVWPYKLERHNSSTGAAAMASKNILYDHLNIKILDAITL